MVSSNLLGEKFQSRNHSLKTKIYFFGILATTLFIFIILRAYYVPLVHDESLTFTIITGSKKWVNTPNNHWLNSGLTYLSAKTFGHSELALRLPNVISFVVYSFFCYKLVVEKSKYLFSTLASLIFLLLNPFLIEFFGLSRGYGLAIAFLSGSIFLFTKAYHNLNNNKFLLWGIIFSILTIYSNFSFIIPIVAIQMSYLVQTLYCDPRKILDKVKLILWGCEILILLPALFFIIELKKSNQLYIGGNKNIIEDTLFSIFDVTFHLNTYRDQNWIFLFLLTVPIIHSLFISKKDSLRFISSILFLVFLLPTALQLIIGMNYPKDRTALYLVIILGLHLHYFLDNLYRRKVSKLSYLSIMCIGIISCCVVFSFLKTINISYTQIWKYDASSKLMLQRLTQNILPGNEYTLGVNWRFQPSLDYYRIVKDYNYLAPIQREEIETIASKRYDYYYIFDGDKLNIKCQEELARFPVTNSKLIKNCS